MSGCTTSDPPTGDKIPMRLHCCAIDPSAEDCTADCTQSSYGHCVPMHECGDDRYYFDEFTAKCEIKGLCPMF